MNPCVRETLAVLAKSVQSKALREAKRQSGDRPSKNHPRGGLPVGLMTNSTDERISQRVSGTVRLLDSAPEVSLGHDSKIFNQPSLQVHDEDIY